MIFTNEKEAQLAQALIEKKRPGRRVRVIKAAPASKEHYIIYDNKMVTKELLERTIGIKYKNFMDALGL